MTTTGTTTRKEEAGRKLAEIAVNMNEHSHGYDAFARAFVAAHIVIDDVGGRSHEVERAGGGVPCRG